MTTSPPQTSRKWCGKEAGHVVMHHPEQRESFSCRGVVEVEAESVALPPIWTWHSVVRSP